MPTGDFDTCVDEHRFAYFIPVNNRPRHLLSEGPVLSTGKVRLCPRCSPKAECEGCGGDITEQGRVYPNDHVHVWCDGCGTAYTIWVAERSQPRRPRAPLDWVSSPRRARPSRRDRPGADAIQPLRARVVVDPYTRVVEKAQAVLREAPGHALCGRCLSAQIQDEGGLTRSAMRALEETTGFSVGSGRCAECREVTTVCSFVGQSS